MRRKIRGAAACLLVLASLTLIPLAQPDAVLADDASVTNCDEASFDAALNTVQTTGGGTITIDCADPITFTGEKTITSDVTIVGDGSVTFDGQDITRLFVVNGGASLALVGLTLQNGNSADDGGAILNFGTLSVTASTFSGNSAAFDGGAIFNFGTLTITASTFSANSAGFGGAILNFGMLTITVSTFSGNSATVDGGAIFNSGSGTLEISASIFSANSAANTGGAIMNFGTLTITASTFSGNSADLGGAIRNDGTLTVSASILADSTGGNCVDFGSLTSLGYNLSDDATCNLTATGDVPSSGAINLGALQDNGGPTHTMLPQTDSAALEAIPPAACASLSSATDQRGVIRPGDGTNCEIGAVELGQVPVQIIITYNLAPGPLPEGSLVKIVILAFGPAGTDLTYQFDCDIDGLFELSQLNDPRASCPIPDDGLQAIPVQVSDGTTTANDQTSVEGINVAPTIESITTNAPVPQGQPVTVTVNASDLGVNDILSYSFDCDNDGAYEIGPLASNQAQCVLDPSAGTTTIGVQVSDDDGGVTTGSVVVGQTLTLCGSYYTGAVSGPTAGGGCPAGTVQLVVPAASPLTFCINLYTGALLWSPRGSCATGYRAHIVPGSGPLNYCESLYTGKLRYSATGQCGTGERAGVIPG